MNLVCLEPIKENQFHCRCVCPPLRPLGSLRRQPCHAAAITAAPVTPADQLPIPDTTLYSLYMPNPLPPLLPWQSLHCTLQCPATCTHPITHASSSFGASAQKLPKRIPSTATSTALSSGACSVSSDAASCSAACWHFRTPRTASTFHIALPPPLPSPSLHPPHPASQHTLPAKELASPSHAQHCGSPRLCSPAPARGLPANRDAMSCGFDFSMRPNGCFRTVAPSCPVTCLSHFYWTPPRSCTRTA